MRGVERDHTPTFWAAPELIDAGYRVFPVDSKAPTVAGGFYGATNDKSQVAAWITEGRGHHDVAVPTGVFGGIVVIDADDKAAYDKMVAKFGPPTYTTKRGGHWLFRHPRNGKVVSNKIAPGLDRKGDGGYVIVPPSKGRKWTNGIPRVEDLPQLPQEFWSKTKGPTPGERKIPQDRKDAAAALIAEHVRGITPETPGAGRHDHLRHLCGVLLSRDVSLVDAEDILKAAWGKVGGDLADRLDSEIRNTLATTQAALAAGHATGVPKMEEITPGLFAELSEVLRWVEKIKPPTNPSEGKTEDNFLSSNAKGTPVERKNIFLKPRDVFAQAGDEPPWVVEPWCARGGVTDLAGAAKLAGKTTFAMCAARAVVSGGWFMGRRTARSPVVYLSEQGNNVEKALRDANIGEDVEDLYILPKRLVLGVPWPSVVEAAVEQCVEVGARLLVVDTFNRFAGLSADKENNAGDVKDAMDPLIQAAQEYDLAVLCIRHANHEGRGRGSTQFYHDVDVVMTMRAPDATMPANVRVLEAVGRYDGIPARTNVEFREGGLYFDLGSDSKVQATRARAAVKDLLVGGEEVVSTDLIKGAVEASGASTGTVNTVLTSLVEAGEIERIGKGRKGDPYRYRTLEILSSNRPGVKAGRKNARHSEPPNPTPSPPPDRPSGEEVAMLFADPPDWLSKQLEIYRGDPGRHLRPLCAAVAAVVLEDGARGHEVREQVEDELGRWGR